MANFIKDFISIERFCYSEAAVSVFNGYTKFKTIILNIDCSNLLLVLMYQFMQTSNTVQKLAISALQLFFPSLFLSFNLIMIHPKCLGNLEFSNILFVSEKCQCKRLKSSFVRIRQI